MTTLKPSELTDEHVGHVVSWLIPESDPRFVPGQPLTRGRLARVQHDSGGSFTVVMLDGCPAHLWIDDAFTLHLDRPVDVEVVERRERVA